MTNGFFNSVSVLLGVRDWAFAPQQASAAGESVESLTSIIVNGDDITDLATANFGSNDISVLLGQGDGTFAAEQNVSLQTGRLPRSLASGDFNGDGLIDLATPRSGDGITVLHGAGDGTLPFDRYR